MNISLGNISNNNIVSNTFGNCDHRTKTERMLDSVQNGQTSFVNPADTSNSTLDIYDPLYNVNKDLEKADAEAAKQKIKDDLSKKYKSNDVDDSFLINKINNTKFPYDNPFDSKTSGTTIYKDDNTSARESILRTGNVLLDLPNWGYKDFINERIHWQKGSTSLYGDPAWFYFKIFFKFDTSFGLLGGVFDPSTYGAADIRKVGGKTTNTALKYLLSLYDDMRYYKLIKGKIDSLYRFINTLSFISCNAPWFFNAVHDVNNALTTNFGDVTAKKSIVIDCMEESIDMRLMTLMDYYKTACYDDRYQKEIIPENLRKFDMDIVVFQAPLRYLHTSAIDLKNRVTKYKSMNDVGKGRSAFDNLMSYKLFSFKGCEFDYDSLNSMLPSEFNNATGFNSKPTIKINYDRAYQHNINEFTETIVGSSGMPRTNYSVEEDIDSNDYKNISSNKNTNKSKGITLEGGELQEVDILGSKYITNSNSIRKEQQKYMFEHPYYYNSTSNVYKALVDASESEITDYMRMIDGSTALGNVYGFKSNSFNHTVRRTVKNLGKDIYNQQKKIGQSFVDRWKF